MNEFANREHIYESDHNSQFVIFLIIDNIQQIADAVQKGL